MNFKSLLSTHTLAAAALLLPLAAQADQWDKKTILTVNEEIQVKDRVLEPGKYVFKLMNSNADRHVVLIYNHDESHIIDTVLTIPDYRLQPTGKSQFQFYETPRGHVKALKAWFYPGDNFGQEFTYPKHPMMLAMASAPPPPAPMMIPVSQPVAQQQPAAMPEPMPQAPPPAEMAQNAPPPMPAAAPAPMQPAPQPRTLPKTASPYPLVGLAGLLFVGAFALLRLKRIA